MIKHTLYEASGVLEVKPEGQLEAEDFANLAAAIDPYIEEKGGLKGLLIYTENFPGWHDFSALISHLKFVNEHHKEIGKVAAVTDSEFLSIMPKVVNHFIAAEVKHFDFDKREEAFNWLSE